MDSHRKVSLVVFILAILSVPAASNLAEAGKAYYVTREAKLKALIFHAGWVLEYNDGTVEWLHFGVKDVKKDGVAAFVHKKPVQGAVRTNSFPPNHAIEFHVSDEVLQEASRKFKQDFGNKIYTLFNCDCVEASRVFAKSIGVEVKEANFAWPITLHYGIRKRNKGFILHKNLDRNNGDFPWNR